MRITFVVADTDLSGGCRVLALHARLLRERGHEVCVIAPAPFRPAPRQRLRALLREGRVRWTTRSHFDEQSVRVRRIEADRPVAAADLPDADVIVATWWRTATWIHGLPPRKGAPVHFVQGWERHVDGQPGELVDAALRLPLPKIVVSEFLARVVRELSPGADITLAANAIDRGQFDAPPRGKQERPTIGFVYSSQHAKGFDVSRAAIARVRARLPALRALGFGAEPPRADAPLPEGAELVVRPPQRRLARIYASADVWLSSSRIEGFGLPALEAMACRTPLVSTRYGGPLGFVRDGVNGFLVEVDDPEALAERALEVLRAPEGAWRRMSAAAHRTAHARSWQDASRELEQGLLRAIARAR